MSYYAWNYKSASETKQPQARPRLEGKLIKLLDVDDILVVSDDRRDEDVNKIEKI